MRIPQLSLSGQTAAIKSDLMRRIEGIIDSGQFILGPEVEAAEAAIASYIGVEHAVGCNSGTDALVLALQALDIGPGDEVITTPFSFFASGAAIARVGALPVFADIEPEYYALRPDLVRSLINEHTKAIIPVHIFGQPADMDELMQIADEHDLPIIEDAAQSIGAQWKGSMTGSLGTIACLSFYPTKNLSAAGDAGMLTTNDPRLAGRIRSLRSHGENPKYHHHELGMNSRLSAINAAALNVKLPHVDSWNTRRREIAALYNDGIASLEIPALGLPALRPHATHCFHQYSIRVSDRDSLQESLAERGIGTAIHYPGVIYRQPCFASRYPEGLCPEAEKLTGEILSLPMYPELSDDEVQQVIAAIKEHYSK